MQSVPGVYDLERRTLLWVGEDRSEQTLRKFFSELGRRRCRTIQVVLMDMWAPYAKAVSENAPRAQVLFDRFHLVQHLNRAVDEVRRAQLRRLSRKEKVKFKRTRYLLLKNPWNLTPDQNERLSTLVSWNTPITRAYYLKESLQLFFDYKQLKRAREHLERWMHSAMRSRLEPFKKLVKMLRSHLDGVLAWTRLRLTNGAVALLPLREESPTLLWGVVSRLLRAAGPLAGPLRGVARKGPRPRLPPMPRLRGHRTARRPSPPPAPSLPGPELDHRH